ncbi:MAG: ORC1-type DNA replication protein [Methanobacteriaceae archaeon]|nr:ORC1-type DNA replication protein [Methanobacteriaceae archaeon]
MGIDDILLHDETIFRNMQAFDPDYIPENFKYRDSQMEALAVCIRPALMNGRPINAVVLGACATGKTTAIKKLFEMVENSSEKVICSYINCQLHTTRFGIFSQIYYKIFGYYPPETGVPFSRIYHDIMHKLSTEDKALIVALDDVNHLFHDRKANRIFYDILRAYEAFDNVRTGIFAVLSDIEFRYALDKNVDSVFIPQEIIFQPYSYEEIYDILKDRARIGFYDGVISDELIDEIAILAFETGDLRYGINLLRVCGNLAEAEASPRIKKAHLEEAIKDTISTSFNDTIKNLSKNEREFLKIIIDAGSENLTAGQAYKEFKRRTGLSYSSFNRILEKLEFLRLIDTPFTGKGRRGNARLIIPRFKKELDK